MSFLFASSHLPETRVQRPEDEEEDDVQPMLHSGSVRAFSHLPAKSVAAEPVGTLSQRSRQALGGQFQRTETQEAGAPPEDGISAAKARDVFDVVRQQFNRDDSPHYMDEDGNLRLRDETSQQDSPFPRGPRSPQIGAGAPTRPAWGTGHAAAADEYSSRILRAPSSAPEYTRPWHTPAITPEDLDPQHFDDDAADGSHSALKGRPGAHDLVYRTHGESPSKLELQDLLYRYKGTPEEVREKRRSYFKNVADAQSAAPALHFTPATPETNRGSGAPGGIAADIDWANANPQKKEQLFPNSAERRMTEQERSLAELGDNANLDSLHELHEWNKSINAGRPVEDKPKANPPLMPRRSLSSDAEEVVKKEPPAAKLSGLPPVFTGPLEPGQKRVSESEMQAHLSNILNHAKISDFDRGGKYFDQRYVDTPHGPVDLKHIVASGTPFSALTILPATGLWETIQGLNKNYRQSAFAPEDLRSNAIGAGASDKSWPEFMSGKTFGDEAARLIGKMGFNSLPYGR